MVYVDDIIIGGSKKEMCQDFAQRMQEEFEMSLLGEVSFFLGLQVTQLKSENFISQTKYAK